MQNAISLLENDPSEISPDPFIVIALIQRGLMNEGSGNGVCVWLTWLEINNRTGGVYIKESDGSRRTEVRWDPHSNRQITKMSSFTRFVPVVMDEKSYEAALAHGCTEGEYLDIRSFKRGAPLVAGMLNEEGHALKPIAVFVTDLLAERWEHGGATNSDE